jgi:RNA polymerase sigma-70 factor (family 1)
MEMTNDIDLLNRLRESDNDAFEQVYTQYFKPLCYFAERLTADPDLAQDIAAETFIQLLRKKPVFDTVAQLRSFLYTTARNRCFDHLRTLKRHKITHNELKYLETQSENEIENNMIRAEVLQAVYNAIEALPNRYRQVVKLALVEGKNNEEIAAETGMAYQTVRNHKYEGIKLLRLAIFKNGNLSDLALFYALVYLSNHSEALLPDSMIF